MGRRLSQKKNSVVFSLTSLPFALTFCFIFHSIFSICCSILIRELYHQKVQSTDVVMKNKEQNYLLEYQFCSWKHVISVLNGAAFLYLRKRELTPNKLWLKKLSVIISQICIKSAQFYPIYRCRCFALKLKNDSGTWSLSFYFSNHLGCAKVYRERLKSMSWSRRHLLTSNFIKCTKM